jgi:dTMP kinase
VVTEWNSSALVKAATRTGKKKNSLTPMTFSLLHATDFADRLLYKIVPPLKAGMIVLADRYAYTAFARDVARGVRRSGCGSCTASPCGPTSRCTSACRSRCRSSA